MSIARSDSDGAAGLVIALSGGIGGAKLALGLTRVVPRERLLVIANTGDDFEHLGLAISPDLDTLMYTLAGIENSEMGWGRRSETWTFLSALDVLGGETWFRLGDGDLATHVERTRRLKAGESLSSITEDFCRRLDVPAKILPMTDDPVRTRLRTDDGWLDFQDYFVRRRCEPRVRELTYEGAASARANPMWINALQAPDLRAVVICPSNPFLSIDPMLAITGVRDALAACRAPVIAISPIVGGRSVKGPTAKMMQELGLAVTASSVARHYGDLLGGYVVDHADPDAVVCPGVEIASAATVMTTLADREALARDVLAFANKLRGSRAESAGVSA